jgi:hypothetical protein
VGLLFKTFRRKVAYLLFICGICGSIPRKITEIPQKTKLPDFIVMIPITLFSVDAVIFSG